MTNVKRRQEKIIPRQRARRPGKQHRPAAQKQRKQNHCQQETNPGTRGPVNCASSAFSMPTAVSTPATIAYCFQFVAGCQRHSGRSWRRAGFFRAHHL
jgi:hypothetical protein